MSDRPFVPDDEDVVRAVRSADYDGARFSSGLLATNGVISVSRLSILDLATLFPIFHRELDRETDPPGKVIGAGQINVGELRRIGASHDVPMTITVEEDPILPDNPAHAVIPQKLSRGIRRKIVEKLLFRPDPMSSGNAHGSLPSCGSDTSY